ncbi:hypothetical protein ACU686_02005 [Yinghuangia aomiensis]
MSSAATPLPGPRAVGAYAPPGRGPAFRTPSSRCSPTSPTRAPGFAEVAAILVHVSHDDIAELRGAAGLVADGTPEPATVAPLQPDPARRAPAGHRRTAHRPPGDPRRPASSAPPGTRGTTAGLGVRAPVPACACR